MLNPNNPRYSAGLHYHPEQWGQRLTVRPGQLQEGQEIVVLQNDGSDQGLPQVRTLLLSLNQTEEPTIIENGVTRWVITSGVGGATSRIIIDALGVQQVSLPSGKLVVSLMAERYDKKHTFHSPNVPMVASAYIAIGETSTEAAKYTSGVGLITLTTSKIPIPSGASAWRMTGTDTAYNPLVEYKFTIPGGVDVVYTGDKLEPLAYQPGFIPLLGGSGPLVINNASSDFVFAHVQWQLDL